LYVDEHRVLIREDAIPGKKLGISARRGFSPHPVEALSTCGIGH